MYVQKLSAPTEARCMCSNSAYLSKLSACVETRCTSRNSMHLQIFGALVETSMHPATIPQFKNGLKVHSESLSAPKISSCAANLWVHRIILNARENLDAPDSSSHIEGARARLRFPVFRETISARVQYRPWSRGLNVSLETAGSTSAVGSTSASTPQFQRRPWAGRRRP